MRRRKGESLESLESSLSRTAPGPLAASLPSPLRFVDLQMVDLHRDRFLLPRSEVSADQNSYTYSTC